MHLKNKHPHTYKHLIIFHFFGRHLFLGTGFLGICLFFILGCAHGPAKDQHTNLFEDTLQIYRGPLDHLSAVRRGVCPMHPSCSEYGRRSIRKHGFFIGWTMTMDRLLRCGRSEIKQFRRVWVAGDWKFYDPVSANDSWWSTQHPQEAAPD